MESENSVPANEGIVYVSIERGQRGGVGHKVSVHAPLGATQEQLHEAMLRAIETAKAGDLMLVAEFGEAK